MLQRIRNGGTRRSDDRRTRRGLARQLLAAASIFLSAAMPLTAQQISLDKLVDSAIQNSADVAGKQAGERKASADLDRARAARFPDIGSTLSFSWIGNPSDGITVKPGELGSIPMPPPTPAVQLPQNEVVFMSPMEPTRYELDFTVKQPIFLWGKIENSIALARTGVTAAALQSEQARNSLETRVRATAYAYAVSGRIETSLEEQVALLKRLEEIVRNGFQDGAIGEIDYLSAQNRVADVEAGLADLSARRALLLEDLRRYTGLPQLDAGDLDLDSLAGTFDPVPTLDSDSLLAALSQHNTQLMLLDIQTRAAELTAQTNGADTPLKPHFAAQLQVQLTSGLLPIVQDGWQDTADWQVIASVAMQTPLFDAGKQAALVRQAEASRDAAVEQHAAAQVEMEGVVRRSAINLTGLKRRIELATGQEKVAARQEAVTRNQSESGIATESDVIQASMRRASYRVSAEQLRLAYVNEYFTAIALLPPEEWPVK